MTGKVAGPDLISAEIYICKSKAPEIVAILIALLNSSLEVVKLFYVLYIKNGPNSFVLSVIKMNKICLVFFFPPTPALPCLQK